MIKLLPPARARLGWSRQPLPVAAVLGDLKENAERYEVKSLPVPIEAPPQATQGGGLFCESPTRRPLAKGRTPQGQGQSSPAVRTAIT